MVGLELSEDRPQKANHNPLTRARPAWRWMQDVELAQPQESNALQEHHQHNTAMSKPTHERRNP